MKSLTGVIRIPVVGEVVEDGDERILDHVVARSGGQLWVNDYISNDGTPCGYLVCKINDKDIKWRYRTISIRNAESVRAVLPKYSYRLWTWKGGVGYIGEKRVDDSIQIQAYGNNTYGDGCVYANVFMWDEKWSDVTLTTSAGKKYVMPPNRSWLTII